MGYKFLFETKKKEISYQINFLFGENTKKINYKSRDKETFF